MTKKLKAILSEYIDVNKVKITEDTDLKNDLGLNSFELADIACSVEDEFDIEIPNKAIHSLITVGDVIKFIEENT